MIQWDQIDECRPVKTRNTKKKVWDQETNTWKDVTIWTVTATHEVMYWLQNEYTGRKGWNPVWTNKVALEEPLYIIYCLKFLS
jgi:hypothetical protein